MADIQSRGEAILRDSFEGVHGGEHYLAGGVTHKGIRRYFLLRLDGLDKRRLKIALINISDSFKQFPLIKSMEVAL